MPRTVEDYLKDLDRELRNTGLPPMDSPTLKEVHTRLSEPSVFNGLQSGQLTVQGLVKESTQALEAAKQRRLQPQGQLGMPTMGQPPQPQLGGM